MNFSQQHSSTVLLFLYILRESITPKLRIILYKLYTVISLVADLNFQLTYDELNNISSENNCESELNNHCKHIFLFLLFTLMYMMCLVYVNDYLFSAPNISKFDNILQKVREEHLPFENKNNVTEYLGVKLTVNKKVESI